MQDGEYPRACPRCGADLTDRSLRTLYCNDACRVAYKRSLDPEGKRAVARRSYAKHAARLKAERAQKEKDQAWLERRRAAGRRYYARNREAAREAARSKREREPAKAREVQRRYRERNSEKVRALNAARDHARNNRVRRTRLADGTVEVIDRFRVWFLGAGRCGECEEPVDIESMHVDHIVPLAGGGEHSYANTQPTHPVCNLRKGVRMS